MTGHREPTDLRLCITGSFGFKDIGDEAMLTEDLGYVVDRVGVPRANITLLGGDPDYIAWYHGHPRERCDSSKAASRLESDRRRSRGDRLRAALRTLVRGPETKPGQDRRTLARLAAEVARADALIVTGGGTINSRDREGFSIRRIHSLIRLFHDHGVPIFLSGQTIGPLGLYPDHDRLAREIVQAADILTTRDALYSARYLAMIGARPHEHLEVLDDAAALEFRDAPLDQETEVFLARGPTAALNITEYTGYQHDQQVFVSRIAEHLIRAKGLQLVLVSHTDLDFCHLHVVRDMLPDELRRQVLLPDTRRWRDRSLKRLISRCRVAIGGRYHFVVFAATSDTPFVGMCGNHYSYVKQDGFARQLGLSDFVLTERETWCLERVVEAIDRALARSLEVEAGLPRPSASMRRLGAWLEQLAQGRRPVPPGEDGEP